MSNPKTREEAEKVCVLWDCNDPERLIHDSPDEAIKEYLANIPGDSLPETITLTGYVRMEPPDVNVLEGLLERFDEECGDPDGGYSKPTPAMLEAEEAFLAIVRSEYKSWACEDVYSEEVNVAAWLAANPNVAEGWKP